MTEKLLEGKHYASMMSLIHNQVNLLTQLKADQEDIIPSIQRLETYINGFFTNEDDLSYIDPIYTLIAHLYDYIGAKESQGDTAYEISLEYFEIGYIDQGFEYLGKSFQIFVDGGFLEKVGMILDYLEQKKDYYSEMDSSSPITDRFFEFFVSCLLRLNQDADAAELMLQRAILLIPVNEELALEQFKAAKSIITELGLLEKRGQFEKAFGSTLLKYRKTNLGMDVLSETEQKTTVEALSIADTYLTSSEDRFNEEDYDSYFTLVNQAMNIYIELEMTQEASTIALSEARKLWSIKNVVYTMIFLEHAWQILSTMFRVGFSQSLQPLNEFITTVIEELFKLNRFDEALGFIELKERIYKQINRPDMRLDVIKRKVDAYIGKGNLDSAISQTFDLLSTDFGKPQLKDVIAFVKRFLEEYFAEVPTRINELLKAYIQLIISNKTARSTIIQETSIDMSKFVLNSLNHENTELFDIQIRTILSSFIESEEEVEEGVVIFVIKLIEGLLYKSLYKKVTSFIDEYSTMLKKLSPKAKLKIIQEFGSLLSSEEKLPENDINLMITFLSTFSKGLVEKEIESVAVILWFIGKANEQNKNIIRHAYNHAITLCKSIHGLSTTLTIYEDQFKREFDTENYMEALDVLDQVIETLSSHFENRDDIIRFVNLLDEKLPTLGKRRKKKWLNLFTEKYQLISEKFLGEITKVSSTEEEYQAKPLGEMIDFTDRKKE
jgi:hypothetical protein